MTPQDAETIRRKLAAPFHPDEIRWKPQAVNGNRALAIAYVNARTIMDRLDDVLGVAGWQDEYTPLEGGQVKCRLYCWIGTANNVAREDVGGQSKQPDAGDKIKSAFSDAFKRAAVKFGVSRYLYKLPSQWVDYDPQKKQFSKRPQLPAWALPDDYTPQAAAPQKAQNGTPDSLTNGNGPVTSRAVSGDGRSVEYVGSQQLKEIGTLAKQHGVDWAKVCAYYACQRIEMLPALHYGDCIAQLHNPKSALRSPMSPSLFSTWLHRWDCFAERAGWSPAGALQEAVRLAGEKMGEHGDFGEWKEKSIPYAQEAARRWIEDRQHAAVARV